MDNKKHQYFHHNLKKAIKKAGYKLVEFPEKHLGCTYQTFNWRLHKGQFYIKDLYICMEVLNVTLEDLTKEVKVRSRKKYTKSEEPINFTKLQNYLNSK